MTDGEGANRAEVGVESPIRVYVGSEEAQALGVKVLEYSIRRRASMDVEVFPLHHARMEFPMPKDARNRPRTPFSFQRFNIPALKGYRGRAIYLDSDMQVFQDIKALWTLPFDGADLLAARERGGTGRKPQFSVMLLNCEELHWDITEIVARLDRGELTYETLMYEMAVARKVSAAISPEWNSLERYVEGETALLHYTDMPTQPWVSRDNPLGHLWVRDLIAATEAGFITRQYVEEQVHWGFVRPSLTYQLDHRTEDAQRLPREVQALDANFVAPYQKMGAEGTQTTGGPLHLVRRVLGRLARAGVRKG
jgi:Glycosyl transferase family 8